MNKNVIIIGASGHGHVIADIVYANGDNLIGFLDDDDSKETLGKVCDWEKFKDNEFIVGIGNNAIREKISGSMTGVKWYTAVHPSAVISKSAKIGCGTAVMPNAVINAGAAVGEHTIVNTGAVVEHDNVIGSCCHISIGVKLGGTVTVGDGTFVGIGTAVRNNISICENCVIGTGAAVVSDIEKSGTYMGVPAKQYLK